MSSDELSDEALSWRQLARAALFNPVLENTRTVFTNRSLRLDRIEAIGFDFDHTLAIYNCEALDNLALKLVSDRLIQIENFSSDFLERIPPPEFAGKGLVVDTQEGTIVKVDRFGHIVQAFRGPERLAQTARRALYGDANFIPHVTHGKRFVQLDSAFAKPEARLFSALSPEWEGRCRELWDLIRSHTDMIHRDDSLKNFVMSSPAAYLQPDLEMVSMLKELRAWGKKLFFLTNSEWHYTKAMVNPALGLGNDPEDLGWIDLFDLVVCEGAKPRFFSHKNCESMENIPEHPKLFRGGCDEELETMIGCKGLDILYVGDHIYSDLITSKRKTHWRTMLVIPELAEELDIKADLPGLSRQMQKADDSRHRTEKEAHHWHNVAQALEGFKKSPAIEAFRDEVNSRCDRSQRVLKQYIDQREGLRNRISAAINPFWGSLFRAGGELTYYGKQLEDFACLYTSVASNLTLYPQNYYFRSSLDYLPHEFGRD